MNRKKVLINNFKYLMVGNEPFEYNINKIIPIK